MHSAAPDPSGHPAGAIVKDLHTGYDMVYVPAGWFVMEHDDAVSRAHRNRAPGDRRRVFLSGYWISKTPVTVAEFKQYCDQTKAIDFPKIPVPPWGWQDNEPMVNVTWQTARDYCAWANGDLPTEAQWEKAARGVEGFEYPWGNEWDSKKLQWNAHRPADAGHYPEGASPYNCLDMAGNCWQWCLDWFSEDPPPDGAVNPTGPGLGTGHVLHGGGWEETNKANFRCAVRICYPPMNPKDAPSHTNNAIGFRLVELRLNPGQ